MDAEHIKYQVPSSGIARIMLSRTESRNAQNKRLLYELNEAFNRASFDDSVRVIILGAEGPDFSSGHDFRDREAMSEFNPVSCWAGFDLPGAEGRMAREEEYYLGFCTRWRDIPKPTIAQVQGRVIAGGLMLIWPCDLIVAAEDALFSDPVVAFGLDGHEFFVHAYELGHRRAKELLFTGEAIDAQKAYACGMVNRVVPTEQLSEFTLSYASQIARMPSMGLKLAKMAVNQSLKSQGIDNAIHSAFGLHQLGHSHNAQLYGEPLDPDGFERIRGLSRRGDEV